MSFAPDGISTVVCSMPAESRVLSKCSDAVFGAFLDREGGEMERSLFLAALARRSASIAFRSRPRMLDTAGVGVSSNSDIAIAALRSSSLDERDIAKGWC